MVSAKGRSRAAPFRGAEVGQAEGVMFLSLHSPAFQQFRDCLSQGNAFALNNL